MAAEVVEQGPEGPTPLELRTRPWHVLSGRLNERLDELAGTDAWTMTAVEVEETIAELHAAKAKLAAAEAALLAQADRLDLAEQANATSTAAWLRGELRLTPRQAKQTVELGRALDSERFPATLDGLRKGTVHAEQARVIVAAVEALPDWLLAEERLHGEAHLAELAASYDARQLERLGRHLLEVIDPETAERELARRLEAEEEAAARAASFTMVDDGHGKARGRFTLPSLQGQMLKKLLEGFANPQIPDAIARTEQASTGSRGSEGSEGSDSPDSEGSGEDGPVARPRRRLTCEVMGDALMRLIESYPVEKVPSSGGLNATVVVTMQLDTLKDGLAPATVEGTGIDVSAGAVRRMACAAGVIPAVLDGKSRVLDLGRRSRLATPAQRLAKLIEQKGLCAIEHCDRPASWGDAHHWKRRWVDHGETNLDDLIMICPRHHTLAHLPGRSVEPADTGRYRITREPQG